MDGEQSSSTIHISENSAASEKVDAEAIKNHNRCEKLKRRALKYDSRVIFIKEALQKLNCQFPDESIFCSQCDASITGGFQLLNRMSSENGSPSPSVILCENVQIMQQKRVLNSTLAHELIHAYDTCRAKVDFTNCLHHACSEIRASNLSGECAWKMEFDRGNVALNRQQEKCVRRRAALSLEENPFCKGKAQQFVDAAWPFCSKDTEPFDANP